MLFDSDLVFAYPYIPGIISPISNVVHRLVANPFCLHLTECSAVLYCDSMAHQQELPPSQFAWSCFQMLCSNTKTDVMFLQ